jgi:HPt (histidine-containing phosphotransfer) domain-containing protein
MVGRVSAINPDALDAIRNMQRPDKPDPVAKVIQLFLDRSQEIISELGRAVATGDTNAIQAAAHSLKSSSANVGADAISKYAQKLEQMARDSSLEDVDETFDALQQAYEPAAHEFGNYLPGESLESQR